MTRSSAARTPAAFKRSLKDRLKKESKERGRVFEHLHREFYLQRFLVRVFSQPGDRWLLKGGASLIVRLPDARYSRDLDLVHTDADLDDAVAELKTAAGVSDLDPFRFQVRDEPAEMTGGIAGATLKVDVYLGVEQLYAFPIDLATQLLPIGPIDYQQPRPVVTMDELAAMPTFALYPLPSQIADKVCAMYGLYGEAKNPSSRYHDLVDLAFIVSCWSFDAEALGHALAHEAQRRGLTLPRVMSSPDGQWVAGYAKTARAVPGLPTTAAGLKGALRLVGAALDPVLSSQNKTGSWDPNAAIWLARP
ncbi:nucleotidyl transferase AbiEii/AbiGii toxin family protein [Rhodococcus sp. NPDC059968]|uniref:nucleotidyl transferase AbiEii/AbiGii toxin family protein n=1 Tax=Rhodococcus sp. NPDC059968 TaxID=3347017 RepID=UPI003670D003